MKIKNLYYFLVKYTSSNRILPIACIFFLVVIIITGHVISTRFIGILFAVTFLAIGLLKPEIFVLMLLAIRPLLDQFVSYNFYYVGSKNINIQAIIGIGLVAVFLFYFFTRRSNFLKYGAAIAALLFLTESMLSILLSNNVISGISNWLRLVSWIVLIFLIAEIFQKKQQFEKFVTACVIAAVISSAIVIGNIGSVAGSSVYHVGERFGGFLGGHSAALTLIVLFPFVVLRIMQTTGRMQVGYTLIAFSVIVAVFLTFVRTAWIGLLVQVAFFSSFKNLRIGRYVRLSIFVLIVILVVSEFQAVEQRLSDVAYLWMSGGMVRAAGSGRIWIWSEYINAFLASPWSTKIFGYGLGTQGIIAAPLGAHNDFLDILVATGVIGLLFYSYFLSRIPILIGNLKEGASSKYRQDIAQILTMIFYCYLVVALINGNIYNLNSMWYIGGGIGLGYAILQSKDKDD